MAVSLAQAHPVFDSGNFIGIWSRGNPELCWTGAETSVCPVMGARNAVMMSAARPTARPDSSAAVGATHSR
jgi:hypothetical protein